MLLAERLFAYRGALRARAELEAREAADDAPAPSGRRGAAPAAGAGASRGEVREVGSTRAELERDPVLSALIDF